MRSSLRFWLAVCLLVLTGAIVVWFKGRPDHAAHPANVAWSQPQSTAPRASALLTTPSVAAATGANPAKPQNAKTLRGRYQISNVEKSIEELLPVSSAILMKNALIDTREPIALKIPADLRASENPGAYIVQSDGAPTAVFQKMLKDAGAEIVAYVPNNAFLVKAASEVASSLESKSGVHSVLAYEPYYKLDTRLMKFAVDGEAMPDNAWLRVTFFNGASPASVASLADAVGTTEKSPFGNQMLVKPRAGTLAQLAQLPEVQIIEPVNPRVAANDLTRVALGISEDTLTNANHAGLTGDKVWVNLNDIGVDSTHAALQGRVFYNGNSGKTDVDGHGTHVAGTILGDHATQIFDNFDAIQTNSLRTNYVTITEDDGTETTSLYLDGSLTNADFRGMAHKAKLFVLSTASAPGVTDPVTDTYLIETAARTNYHGVIRPTNEFETLISNNSWNYANTADYDSQAARYDAATRDALPEDTGEQPITFVFAAGNEGFGGEDGQGGEPGTIASPGTAKNVITVGALESPRFIAEGITNVEDRLETDDNGQVVTNKVTNVVQIFRPTTDSDNQVASFSSRGNVGIGIEGASGRFKPDLVAPGTFLWSARSKDWNLTNDFDPSDPSMLSFFNVLSNLNSVSTKYRYDSGTSFSAGGVSGLLALVQEYFTHKLPADRRRNLSPALMKALLINAARSVNSVYDWDPSASINYQGWGLVDLRNLITAPVDDEGKPLPTTLETMSESDWPIKLIDQSPTNAVATGEERTWNLTLNTNALSGPLRFTLVWTDPPGNPQVGVKLVNDLDLSVEVGGYVFHGNDFLSGSTSTEAREPFTGLAIDDPHRDSINNVEKIVIPDPTVFSDTNGPIKKYTVRVAGRRVNVKAVNDYYEVTGRTNEIVQDFALVVSADNFIVTNAFENFDRVANVTVDTNVFVQPVYNGVEATNQRVGANSPLYWTNGNSVQWRFYIFTNSDAALNAGFGIDGLKAGSNVAFITSGPLNVGAPRNVEPDIDMYVSKDSRLTNLNPTAIANSWKSTTRLGTEQVVFAPTQFILDKDGNPTTNTVQVYDPNNTDLGGVIVGQVAINDVFYIGVRSQDQQAAEFSFIAISSQGAFEEERDGVRVINMLPAPLNIPDGSANLPRGRRYYGVPLRGGRIQDTSVYLGIQHEDLGDLVGTLGHGSVYATLNNHSLPAGFTNFLSLIYSDFPFARPFNPLEYPLSEYISPPGFTPFNPVTGPSVTQSDGPRRMDTYAGLRANPVWTLDLVDNAPSHTGTNWQVEVHVVPLNPALLNGETILGDVAGGEQDFYPLDVPADATKVTIRLDLPAGANTNIVLLVRKDLLPSTTQFDYMTNGSSASVTITFDRNSQPPLIPGEYLIGVVNLGTGGPVNYALTAIIESEGSAGFRSILGDTGVLLTDDARTRSESDLLLDRVVTEASVAVLSHNARVSDLVLRLTSPQGTSIILSENRGYFDNTGFGSSIVTTNGTNGFVTNSYAVFTEELGNPIKFVLPPFGDAASTRGFAFGNSFEKAKEDIYTAGQTFDGWKVDTNEAYVVYGEAAAGNMYANLPQLGAFSQTIPTIKGRPYRLTFALRGKPEVTRAFVPNNTDWTTQPQVGPLFSTGQIQGEDPLGSHTNAPNGTFDRHYRIVNNPDPNFPPVSGQDGSTLFIAQSSQPPFPTWFADDTNSQWVALMPQNDNNHPVGSYTNRTSFIITEDPATVLVNARFSTDDALTGVYINGVQANAFFYSGGGASVGYSTPVVLNGQWKKGLNTMDFVVRNDGGSEGFRAQLSLAIVQSPAPTNSTQLVTNTVTIGYLSLNGVSNTIYSVTGSPNWEYYEAEFVADTDNMKIQFYAGATLPGVDIDDVILEDTGTVYLKPEESLSILEGERAMGEWKLEALDNRTGAVVPSIIDDWQLLLGIANPARFAEPLAAGIAYPARINNPIIAANTNVYTPGRILAGETEWFYFDVCDNATVATVRLFAPSANTVPVELLVDRSGFPTGDPARDDYEIIRTTAGTNSTVLLPLTLNNPPAAPLRPGKRLFIGVRAGGFPSDTNNTFRINIQPNGCAFIPPTILSLNETVENVAFPPAPGDEGSTYQATVSGPTAVQFTAQSGSLTLLASNGTEPTTNNYQLKTTASNGTATLNLPSAGTWYFRVVNESDTTVQYTITVGGSSSSTIKDVSVVDNHLKVTWQSVAGTTYEIATSTDLINWSVLTTVQASSTTTTYTDPNAIAGKMRFLRIRPL